MRIHERIHDIFYLLLPQSNYRWRAIPNHIFWVIYTFQMGIDTWKRKKVIRKSFRAFTSQHVMDNIWIYSTCTQFYDWTSTAYVALTILYMVYTEKALTFASCLFSLIAMDIYALVFDIRCTNLCMQITIRPEYL